jgi:GR25 family glycosyltransferase involved in LPS biosynthesis
MILNNNNSLKFSTYLITLNDNYKNDNLDNLKFTIIKGINGKLLNNDSSNSDQLNKFNSVYQNIGPKSAMGCALSHIQCWETFIKSDDDYCLILEDDIFIDNDKIKLKINDLIEFYIEETPKSFDMLYLGYIKGKLIENLMYLIGKTKNSKSNSKFNSKYIEEPNLVLGLHSYILSKQGANKLLNLIKKNPINHHLDYYIQNLYKNNLIDIYITKPRLFYQTSTYSTESNNISIFKLPFFKELEIDNYVSLNYLINVSLLEYKGIVINIWILIVIFILLLVIIFKTLFNNKKNKERNIKNNKEKV